MGATLAQASGVTSRTVAFMLLLDGTLQILARRLIRAGEDSADKRTELREVMGG